MKSLISYLGIIILLSGAFTLIPVPVAFILKEPWVANYFAGVGFFFIVLGYCLQRFMRRELELRDAFIISALGWLLMALIGALPYVLLVKAPFLNAYFESMAGFTTTGINVFNPSELPRTLVFWRSLTQWLGGLGVILVVLVILAPTTIASKLYVAEARSDRLEPNIINTARDILYIYLLFTALGIVALYLAGLPLFHAVNHVLAALPTGGFSSYDNNYVGIASLPQIITMVLMLMGGTSFAVHQKVLTKDFKSFYTNLEVRAMASLVILFVPLLLFEGMSLIESFFQAVSALTTTGFNTVDISKISDLSKCYLTILMNIGAGYGGTGGGIKLLRFVVVIKAVEWYIKKMVSPSRAIIPFKIQNKVFSEDEVFSTLLFCLLYIAFLIPSTIIFVKLGNSFVDSVFMISSAQGNVGLITFTGYNFIEKIIMIFHMWIGRLEIIPILVLLVPFREKWAG